MGRCAYLTTVTTVTSPTNVICEYSCGIFYTATNTISQKTQGRKSLLGRLLICFTKDSEGHEHRHSKLNSKCVELALNQAEIRVVLVQRSSSSSLKYLRSKYFSSVLVNRTAPGTIGTRNP